MSTPTRNLRKMSCALIIIAGREARSILAPKACRRKPLRLCGKHSEKSGLTPQFGRDYERLTAEPLEPITGGEIEKFLQDIPEDSKVRTVMQQVLGAGPVPAAR
jgi:hypothetical protein